VRWLDLIADPVRLHILRLLNEVGEATAAELAASSQTSYQTLRRRLEALQAFGVVEARPGKSDGETPGRPATRFSLSPAVRESVSSELGAAR
jgi:predicted ArsR family transcriptional regulator